MAFAYAAAIEFTEEVGELTCGSNSVTVDFNFTKIADHKREFTTSFVGATDAGCSVYKSKDDEGPLVLTTKYDACGMKLTQDGDNLIYSQTIRIVYGKNPKVSGIIREETALDYEFSCVASSKNEVPMEGEKVVVDSVEAQKIEKSGEGGFDITLIKTADGTYKTQDAKSQSSLGDRMYFKVEMDSVRNDLKLAVTSCYATDAQGSKNSHDLIVNGCPNEADGTVEIDETNSKKTFTWSAEAFRFTGASNSVFVTCDVVVCDEDNQSAACQRCGAGVPNRRRRALAYGYPMKIHKSSVSSAIFTIA